MTQQSPTTQQVQQGAIIPPVLLPYEISKAILESTGTLKALEGVVSGVDTQNERTDLITQARDYLESGLMNVAGLVIGVLFVVAGVYLLFLEFKSVPQNADVRRVVNDVTSRRETKRKQQTAQVKARKTQTKKRRASYAKGE